jgi:hypothetical protein
MTPDKALNKTLDKEATHAAISIAHIPVPVPRSKIRGLRSLSGLNKDECKTSCLATENIL